MNSNSLAGVLGLWMLLQLALTLAILLGGLYALFCLSRAASGLDRMASALEEWLARQNASTPPPSAAAQTFSQRLQPVAAPDSPVPPTEYLPSDK